MNAINRTSLGRAPRVIHFTAVFTTRLVGALPLAPAWPLSKDNRTTLRYREVGRPTTRGAKSRGVADLPIGARSGLRRHRGTAKE
jgi:hypothetical protein